MCVIRIDAGSDTEAVLKAALAHLSDEDLDLVGVERKTAPAKGLASEPVTIGVVLTIAGKVAVAVAQAITAYLNFRAAKLKAEQKTQAPVNVSVESASNQTKEVLGPLKDLPNVTIALKG